MLLLDQTLPTPAENLALDEALLQAPTHQDTLRLWEPGEPMVVLGRSSRVAEEIDRGACDAAGAAILRRVSGGAAIVTGPGCLMYTLVLDAEGRAELGSVDRSHAWVMRVMVAALSAACPTVTSAGTSDLALRSEPSGPLRKFSGNSVRVVRSRLLYHGTLLYDFDLASIGRLLRTPPRQPEYRDGRGHDGFVANLPVDGATLRAALITAWGAETPRAFTPDLADATRRLAEERYTRPEWNLSR